MMRCIVVSSVRGSRPGAPNNSSGRVVPRPSDNVVPSSITVPAYARAIGRLAAFGLGFTQLRSPTGQP